MSGITAHEEKMLNLQHQMRQNQSELQSYLAGLDDWEKEIKEKEQNLKAQKTEKKTTDLPPVRNTIEKKKLKKRKKKEKQDPNKPRRISGYDFRAWDKFDVDKALEEVDENKKKDETSSSEYETDEEWEMERKKHLADLEKEKGNQFLKSGNFERAVEAYSKGMEYDNTNSILPANRALALIKQQKFAAAEIDCTSSIVLDPLYVKAYLRRATARVGVNKVQDALSDYRRVLDLEPANKQAKGEMERLEKELLREKEGPVKSSYTEGQKGIIKPVYKSPEDRSKTPMKRIIIEEIGVETASRPQRSQAGQSEVVQEITAKEGQAFDKLFTKSHSSSSSSSTVVRETQSPPCQEAVGSSSSNHQESVLSKTNGIKHLPQPEADCAPNKSTTDKIGVHPTSKETSVASKRTPGDVKQIEETQNGRVGSQAEVIASDGDDGAGGDGQKFQVPQSSFQFQADFKLLKKKPEQFFQYFQAIPPSQYPKLFGQCLDADILNAILNSLALNKNNAQADFFDILHNLTQVKRFSMTAMFLSAKEKKVIEELLKHVADSRQHSEDKVKALRQKYQL